MWPVVTEELNFQVYFILINLILTLNSCMQLDDGNCVDQFCSQQAAEHLPWFLRTNLVSNHGSVSREHLPEEKASYYGPPGQIDPCARTGIQLPPSSQ